MGEDKYLSEDGTETTANSTNMAFSSIESMIEQDTERLEQYPKVVAHRRVIARVSIESD